MKWHLLLTTTLVALQLSAEPVSAPWKVSLRGVGPVRIGMSVTEVGTAVGELRQLDEADGDCYFAELLEGPDGLLLMLQHNRVVRIDIDRGTLKTVSGIGIGASEADVYKAYPGQIESEPHEYTNGRYLFFLPRDPADQSYGLVFETDGETVVQFRVGLLPQVQWVEGCS